MSHALKDHADLDFYDDDGTVYRSTGLNGRKGQGLAPVDVPLVCRQLTIHPASFPRRAWRDYIEARVRGLFRSGSRNRLSRSATPRLTWLGSAPLRSARLGAARWAGLGWAGLDSAPLANIAKELKAQSMRYSAAS